MADRHGNIPLRDASAIYRVLTGLAIGEVVPDNIYISDYVSGSIPHWIVREREPGPLVTALTLVDESLPLHVGIEVFTCASKTLGGQFYQYYPGCEKARNTFADIRQRARQIAEQIEAGYLPYASTPRQNADRKKLEAWSIGAKITAKKYLVSPPGQKTARAVGWNGGSMLDTLDALLALKNSKQQPRTYPGIAAGIAAQWGVSIQSYRGSYA